MLGGKSVPWLIFLSLPFIALDQAQSVFQSQGGWRGTKRGGLALPHLVLGIEHAGGGIATDRSSPTDRTRNF